MTLLNNNKVSETENLSGKSYIPYWIMDIGASHHLTRKFKILTDVRQITPIIVILADGRESVSDKEWTVRLGLNLVLRSVFYVEEFHQI